MSKHSQEPWRKTFGGVWTGDDVRVLSDSAPDYSDMYRPRRKGEHAANIERIISCVNACKGINPEAVPNMPEVLKLCIDELRQHRINDAARWCDDYDRQVQHADKSPAIIAARAVLAKVMK